MKLAESLGFESDKSCSDGLADREVGRVYLVELSASARHRFARVLKGTIDEGRITRELARRIVGYVSGADGAVEDIWVGRGDVLKNRHIEAKIFGENVSGSASNPVVNIEGCAGLECQWLCMFKIGEIDTYPTLSKSASSNTKRNSFSSSSPWTV